LGAEKGLRHPWQKELVERQPPAKATDTGSVGKPLWLTTEEFLVLTSQINTWYLVQGFDTTIHPDGKIGNADCGFFTGKIHLLRGGTQPRDTFL